MINVKSRHLAEEVAAAKLRADRAQIVFETLGVRKAAYRAECQDLSRHSTSHLERDEAVDPEGRRIRTGPAHALRPVSDEQIEEARRTWMAAEDVLADLRKRLDQAIAEGPDDAPQPGLLVAAKPMTLLGTKYVVGEVIDPKAWSTLPRSKQRILVDTHRVSSNVS